jgi:sugar phosphate isomerase/epimerase
MSFSRRSFLNTISAGAVGLGAACTLAGSKAANAATRNLGPQEPLRKPTGVNIGLGLAAYSFRKHFEFSKGKPNKPDDGRKINMFGFVDYCAKQHCGAELTSYFFPPDVDRDYFLRIKRHAFLNGVPIVGTAIGNNFTIGKGQKLDEQIAEAKRWIDRAAIMGAPHIRFFAGTRKQLEAAPDNMKIAIESLRQCVDYAAQSGILIGVENHGQLTAAQVLEIVKGVDSEWFGINLDTGNFNSDDPYRDLEKCAPYAVNVQLKVKMKSPAGEKYDADYERIFKILADANYRGYLVLEFEENKPFDHVPDVMNTLRKCIPS